MRVKIYSIRKKDTRDTRDTKNTRDTRDTRDIRDTGVGTNQGKGYVLRVKFYYLRKKDTRDTNIGTKQAVSLGLRSKERRFVLTLYLFTLKRYFILSRRGTGVLRYWGTGVLRYWGTG